MLCYTVQRSSLQALPLQSSLAPLILGPHRLAQLISSSATQSSAAQVMLCHAVWDISHQVLLHRLA